MVPKSLQSQQTSKDMDPRIWSKLPRELLEHVLSFLPLKTFLNLRSTCKHFNSLIFSPPFISKHYSSSTPYPFSSFLLLSHPQFYHKFHLYDSVLGSWRNIALSLSITTPGGEVAASSPSSCTLISSSGGLFCFSLPGIGSFLVSNVLAKSSRIIEFPFFPFSFESLSFVSTPFGYKIFILCSKFFSNFAFLYDSKSNSWRKFDCFEPILSANHLEGVFSNGSLYFSTPEPFSVVSFDLDNEKWGKLESDLPRELTFVRLVSDNSGKLYLVGGIGSNGISRSLKLWELDNGRNWVEVESLPEMMCRKLLSVCYHNYEHVYCFWLHGMVCVCCYNWPEILYFKVSRRTWHWLPRCPSLPEKWSCGFKWFPFVPDLYVSV